MTVSFASEATLPSWRAEARAQVRTSLLERLARSEVPDDGLWSGRISSGDFVVHGLLDQIMLAVIDAQPSLLDIYPRGEAVYYLKRDFGSAAKLLMRRHGYEFFPSEEADSQPSRTRHWQFVRLPSAADDSARLLVVADYYRRRSSYHETVSNSRASLAKRDAEQSELWKSEAALRPLRSPVKLGRRFRLFRS